MTTRPRSRPSAAVVVAIVAAALVAVASTAPPAAGTPGPVASGPASAPGGDLTAVGADLPTTAAGVGARRYVNPRYRAQAKAQARKHGLTIRWVAGAACAGVASSVGCYRSGSTRITLSRRLRFQPKQNVRFVVGHEAAHHHVFRRCGTARPPVAGSRFENVTDAYAAKVLRVGGIPGYGYRTSDVAKAKKIRAGRCWSKQRTVRARSTGAPFLDPVTHRTRYVVAKGARLALLGKVGGLYVVRDGRNRTGHVDPVAWKAPTRTITAKRTSSLWRYPSVTSSRTVKVGERFGLLGSYDRGYYVARASGGRLVLVAKRSF